MKSLTPWLAMLLSIVLVACSDEPPRDPAKDGAPTGPSCQGSAPVSCEEAVDDVDDCPGLDDVCDGVCGAAYDCCYCGDDGQWQTLYLDCPLCQDAAIADAAVDAL